MFSQLASADRTSVWADDAILPANARYAASFAGGDLKSPPRRRFAVVTCMDARLDPARFLGLEEGDAHVIRNAGGVVSPDALRSLIVSHWLLGTRHAYVIGHTDCGMAKVDDDGIRARLEAETGEDASEIEFLTFTRLEQAVSDSVARIRESKLLPEEFGATGYVYEVATGRLRRVS